MDDNNRNLILATVLSFLVILVWYTVFAPEPVSDQPSGQPLAQQSIGDQPLAPAAGTTAAPAELGAEVVPDPAEPVGRVAIRSEALEGSISLVGGRLDDLLLTRYRETLDDNSPQVRLLSPSSATADDRISVNLTKPYYAIYGWTPGAGVDPALVPGPGHRVGRWSPARRFPPASRSPWPGTTAPARSSAGPSSWTRTTSLPSRRASRTPARPPSPLRPTASSPATAAPTRRTSSSCTRASSACMTAAWSR